MQVHLLNFNQWNGFTQNTTSKVLHRAILAANLQANSSHEKCKQYGQSPYRLKAIQCTYTQLLLHKRRCMGQTRKELETKVASFPWIPRRLHKMSTATVIAREGRHGDEY